MSSKLSMIYGVQKSVAPKNGVEFPQESIGVIQHLATLVSFGPVWPRMVPYGSIWSKVMRIHIGLIICHFLVSGVSITESPKNKIMGKTGFYVRGVL